MPLGLFPEENAQALDTLYRGSPMGPPQPHWYQGMGSGIATGIGEGAMKAGLVVPLQAEHVPTVGYNLPESAYEEPPKPISPEFRPDPRAAAAEMMKQLQSNPATTGFVGQVLHNVASVGTRATIGGLLGGPLAGVAVAGGAQYYSSYQTSLNEGIDEHTAKTLAAADGLMTGAGLLLPVGVGGSTAVKMLSGATINLAAGAGSRALTHTILADAGYDAQAAQYKVLDGQSLASDAILGLAFGWLGRNHDAKPVPQAVVDAAHVAEDAAHVETGLFGDVPVTGQGRNDHMQNVIDATHAELNGEPVSNMRPVETIANPAQEAAREAGAKGLDSAVTETSDELAGPRIEPEAVPEKPPLPEPDVTKPGEEPAAAKGPKELVLDPDLAEALAQAQDVIDRNPDKAFVHPETGEAADPQAAINEAMRGVQEGEGEGKLAEVAAACFGRG